MGTKIFRSLIVVTIGALVSACASMSGGSGKGEQSAGVEVVQSDVEDLQSDEKVVSVQLLEHLAAIDLVNSMVQVAHLHPVSAPPIEMNDPQFGFGKQLHDVLKLAGYDVQIVDGNTVEGVFLKYSQGAESTGTTYRIEIDDFKVRRTYAIVDNNVIPRSPLFVFGIDPALIKANDGIFVQPVKSGT